MLIDVGQWKAWGLSEFLSGFLFFMNTGQLFSILVCDAGSTHKNSSRYSVFEEGVNGERKMQAEEGRILR